MSSMMSVVMNCCCTSVVVNIHDVGLARGGVFHRATSEKQLLGHILAGRACIETEFAKTRRVDIQRQLPIKRLAQKLLLVCDIHVYPMK